MSWTDERVEALKLMWSEGKSASQIAKELGGVTRNAVIGKVHRLGLSNRAPGSDRPEDEASLLEGGIEDLGLEIEEEEQAPVAKPAPQPVAAAAAPRPVAKETVPVPRPKPAGQPMPPQPSASEISAEALANLAEVAKKARRLTLMQLTERTCKWPVGDPATDDFWFCGLPAVAGKPYCETHVAVAFQPMSARRDRRAGGR
ncbi:MAG: GcrA family cell cycle regulator [Amaricoccus sp.]